MKKEEGLKRLLYLLYRTIYKLGACMGMVLALVAGGEGATKQGDQGSINLLGIQHCGNSIHTRVILELDQSASYKCNSLDEDTAKGLPYRIYLDLSKTSCKRTQPRTIPFSEGPIKAVRIGQYDKNTTRVVLDVRKVEDYRISTLSSPDRIVIDLWKEKDSASSSKPPSLADSCEVSEKAPYIPRIVIDPGHGGDDPGAIGKNGLMEKDVALRVSKLLKTRLEQALRVDVFLTRSNDIYLSLGKRTAIANAKKADIFVSIHANAHNSRSVSGVETYYLDNTTDKASIRLAALENASSGHKLSDLQRILLDLRRNSNVLESNSLAHIVQDSLVSELAKGFHGVTNHGAKANLFYVLMGADMPSILVEISFITNLKEERLLQNRQYLERIADGIKKGICQYLSNQYLPALQAQR